MHHERIILSLSQTSREVGRQKLLEERQAPVDAHAPFARSIMGQRFGLEYGELDAGLNALVSSMDVDGRICQESSCQDSRMHVPS